MKSFLLAHVKVSMVIFMMFTSTCKSEKPINKKSEPFNPSFSYVDFGYGGGFAGTYNFFRLMENGNVWKLENEEPVNHLYQIPADSLRSIAILVQKLIESDFQIDMLGNMTYFLKIQKENTDYNYKWMEEVEQPVTKASILYDRLNRIHKESLKQ